MFSTKTFQNSEWALILGGSSGFGLACARKLSQAGMSVCVVHRDRRGAMERIEKDFAEIRANGAGFLALNVDALAPEGIASVLETLKEKLGSGKIRVLLHSIAYGNLKPIAPPVGATSEPGGAAGAAQNLMEEEDLARTVHSMGTSLLTWVQRVFQAGLFARDARVFGLTSEGNSLAWKGYAAVAAAKCTLESLARAIAVEFGPHGIRANILQPGVTDTPALRLIPGSDKMKDSALARNPMKRLTTPEDVADVLYLMSRDEARWINGALIRVDGGEHIGSA